LEAAAAAAQASYNEWCAERRRRGHDMMQAARRIWAAVQGWDQVKTQDDWERLRDQTIEDWENGSQLLTMLGGVRYVQPEGAALAWLWWRHFCEESRARGPAESRGLAVAFLSSAPFLRVNTVAHNVQPRREPAFSPLPPLTTDRSVYGSERPFRGQTASQMV